MDDNVAVPVVAVPVVPDRSDAAGRHRPEVPQPAALSRRDVIRRAVIVGGGGLLAEGMLAFQGVSRASADGPGSGTVTTVDPLASPATMTLQARKADTFVDFLAVVTHLNYLGEACANVAFVGAAMNDIGFRHYRDGWGLGRPGPDSGVIELHSRGLKLSFIVTYENGCTPAQLRAHFDATPKLVACLDYLEGPNEWNLTGGTVTIDGVSHPIGLNAIAGFMKLMWETFHATGASTAAVPILGPSIGGPIQNPGAFRTVGDISSYTDFGNSHDYFGGDEGGADDLLAEVVSYNAIMTGGQLLVTTESGWTSPGGVNPPTGGNPSMANGIIAKDMLRMHLMRWATGRWLRSGVYELVDEPNDDGWGLLVSNADAVKFTASSSQAELRSLYKPQAFAHRALTGLLSDQGGSFSPGRLAVTLEGATRNTQSTLLQKSNGTFFLAIWENDAVYWNLNQGDAAQPQPKPVPVILTLPGGRASMISQYRPSSVYTTAGVAEQISVSTNTATVGIASLPEPTLVEIKL